MRVVQEVAEYGAMSMNLLADYFAGKSPGALLKRVNSLNRLCNFLDTIGVIFLQTNLVFTSIYLGSGIMARQPHV